MQDVVIGLLIAALISGASSAHAKSSTTKTVSESSLLAGDYACADGFAYRLDRGAESSPTDREAVTLVESRAGAKKITLRRTASDSGERFISGTYDLAAKAGQPQTLSIAKKAHNDCKATTAAKALTAPVKSYTCADGYAFTTQADGPALRFTEEAGTAITLKSRGALSYKAGDTSLVFKGKEGAVTTKGKAHTNCI